MGEIARAQAQPLPPAARPRSQRARRRRVFIEDARQNGQYLRATWHPEGRMFVVSTWREEVCTGAIRVSVEESDQLAGLLVDGLARAAATPPDAPPPTVSKALAYRWERLGTQLHERLDRARRRLH